MNAIGLGEDSAVALRRIFGVGRWTLLGQLSNLPACMKTILNS
jgi:hypothetical protein